MVSFARVNRIKKGLRYYVIAACLVFFFVMPKLSEIFFNNPLYQKYIQQALNFLRGGTEASSVENVFQQFFWVNISIISVSCFVGVGIILFIEFLCFVFISLKTTKKLWPSVCVKAEERIEEKITFFVQPNEKITA